MVKTFLDHPLPGQDAEQRADENGPGGLANASAAATKGDGEAAALMPSHQKRREYCPMEGGRLDFAGAGERGWSP